MQLDEFTIPEMRKGFKGTTIRELDVRHLTGANVVGLKAKDGSYTINPQIDRQLDESDILIILGTAEQMTALRKILS